jgi:ferredoxin--NADP+ reductase
VELLLEDLRDAPRKGRSAEEVEAFLAERVPRLVMYRHWTTIDELERAAGEKVGRPRVKLCTWDELLDAAERVAAS